MDITEEEHETAGPAKPKRKKDGICIICGAKAGFFIRGVPSDTYCEECSDELFGKGALDKIE
ncbi:hypothetical protein JXB28_03170 [Candidatus Woesearchaeota archaeon]|nr:hypothetical protein [Candidatus Woesearchaeota archaeon]